VTRFSEYEEIQAARKKLLDDTVDSFIEDNMEALLELAK